MPHLHTRACTSESLLCRLRSHMYKPLGLLLKPQPSMHNVLLPLVFRGVAYDYISIRQIVAGLAFHERHIETTSDDQCSEVAFW